MSTKPYPLLQTINDPADLRQLSRADLKVLATELRGFVIDSVSQTGGHLSSNLGTVELTVALHHVFNTPEDGRARKDSYMIRRTAVTQHIPYYLTVDGAQAAIGAIEALLKGEQGVRSLQEYHGG